MQHSHLERDIKEDFMTELVLKIVVSQTVSRDVKLCPSSVSPLTKPLGTSHSQHYVQTLSSLDKSIRDGLDYGVTEG